MNDETVQLHNTLRQFGLALSRLGEALQRDASKDSLVLDATIQRFEFSVELMWKTLKRALSISEGFDPPSPRQTLQKAWKVGWIDHEALWVAMLKDRNLTPHTYKEDLAREIHGRIREYYPELDRLYRFLAGKFLPD